MAISVGSFASDILRMAAENQIERSKANEAIIRAQGTRSVVAATQEMILKDYANDVQDAQSNIQIAQSAVQVASSGYKAGQQVGETASNIADKAQTTGQLESGLDGARSGLDAGDDQALGDLMNERLTDETVVSDRFSEDQVRLLADGHVDQQSLQDAGFSEAEAKQLTELAEENGGRLSTEDAAEWMYDNRLTAEQVAAKQEEAAQKKFANDLENAIHKNFGLAVNGVADGGKENLREAAADAAKDGDRAEEIRNELREADQQHEATLAEHRTAVMRRRRSAFEG